MQNFKNSLYKVGFNRKYFAFLFPQISRTFPDDFINLSVLI